MDTTNVEMTYVNILFWIGGISIRQNCLRPLGWFVHFPGPVDLHRHFPVHAKYGKKKADVDRSLRWNNRGKKNRAQNLTHVFPDNTTIQAGPNDTWTSRFAPSLASILHIHHNSSCALAQ
jgi:hypothetical protein